MIKKIIITKGDKTILDGFELELEKLTVITGENNSGKTNFIKIVNEIKDVKFLDEKGMELNPEIVYIAAENIRPSDSECKHSAKSTGLIENLSKLFSNLEIDFKLENQDTIIENIENLIRKANENLKSFAGHNKHELKIIPNKDDLDSDVIIQALIKEIVGLEDGQKRKLVDLGQGTQRVIIASILKAYVDILVEKEIYAEKPVLILLEEPEIYLHPRLKRMLNATLERMVEQSNHQVIITTHDPYFAFKNFEGENKIIFSFEKGKNGFTKISDKKTIWGIEDELLFIYLFSLLEDRIGKKGVDNINIEGFKDRKYFNAKTGNGEVYSDLRYIRHQIHHLGDNPYTKGLVCEKTKDCDDKNYYTEEELSAAIKTMSKILGDTK